MRVFSYGYTREEEKQLQTWVQTVGISHLEVLDPAWSQSTIAAILRGQALTGPLLTMAEKLILFHEVTDAQLDRLVATYSALKLEAPLWAMTTATNQTWTLPVLLRALIAERNEIMSQEVR
jgi:hypothetical protein